MGVVIVLAVPALLAFIPSTIAARKGRNAFGWWIYGFLIFIVALPHALLIDRDPDGMVARGNRRCPNCTEWIPDGASVCRYCGRNVREHSPSGAPVTAIAPLAGARGTPAMKTCPRCAEDVRAAAVVCRYCGHEFPAPAVAAQKTKPGDGKRICPNCGSEHDSRQFRCATCGWDYLGREVAKR